MFLKEACPCSPVRVDTLVGGSAGQHRPRLVSAGDLLVAKVTVHVPGGGHVSLKGPRTAAQGPMQTMPGLSISHQKGHRSPGLSTAPLLPRPVVCW